MTLETYEAAKALQAQIRACKSRIVIAMEKQHFHEQITKYKGSIGNIEAAERAAKQVKVHCNTLAELNKQFEAL